MAVVVDDCEDVWFRNNKLLSNVILVKPFHCTEQDATDNHQLILTADILCRVHERYYSNAGRVMGPLLLQTLRKNVLADCTFCAIWANPDKYGPRTQRSWLSSGP
jgi:hypothetical protein